MRIGIDIQTTLGQKTGFGFYVSNLIENIAKIDRKNKYILLRPESEQDFSVAQRFWWDQARLPKLARQNQVDILHQPSFSSPVFYRGKVVVTVHDIISNLFPQNLPLASRLFYSRWMPFSYRNADLLITISESTKRDMARVLKIDPTRVRVIHSGVGHEFKPDYSKTRIGQVKAKYKITKPYVLHVGTLEPRKNLEFLVEAFAAADQEELHGKYQLVITGKKGWYFEGLYDLIKDMGLNHKVILTGYVDDRDMPPLYSGATLFAFPSLYEGFGFPPLEAMASGVPVISANTSSLPEIVAAAGILLDPNDKPSWTREIIRVLAKRNLHRELSQLGIKQAAKFSWEKTARKTIEVYEELGNQ